MGNTAFKLKLGHIIFLATANLLAGPAHAGFFDRLVDRVESSVENAVSGRVAGKAGDEAGRATDAVLNPNMSSPQEQPQDTEGDGSAQNGSFDDRQSQSQNQYQTQNQATAPQNVPSAAGLGGMLQALQQKANYNNEYAFDFEVETEMTADGETTTMVQAYGDDAFMIDLEDEQRMILDVANQSMLMINDKERSVMAMSTQFMKQMASIGGSMARAQGVDADLVTSVRKTGQTKQVAGYLTHQWVFEGSEGNGEIWVAESLDFDFVQFNKQLMSLFDDGSGQFSVDFSKFEGEFPAGLPLETVSYKNGKVEHTSRALRVSENPSPLNLSGYRAQSMMGN